ncbi:hypothetical protein Acsp01_20920 [Actinoplanes sp. NBRC 101535]|nr:hypothetical protein Acsp01_20920 [Actinoplanes sp. NBRC 101535]
MDSDPGGNRAGQGDSDQRHDESREGGPADRKAGRHIGHPGMDEEYPTQLHDGGKGPQDYHHRSLPSIA